MSIKENLHQFFIGGEHFRKEFKNEIRWFIIFSLGFTIAFSWRQTSFDAFEAVVKSLTNIQDPTYASVATSSVITIVSIVIIFVSSKLLQND